MYDPRVPSISEIRKTFTKKPGSYKVSLDPTYFEIRKLRKAIASNLKEITCLQPGADTTGWLWILLDPLEWQDLLMSQRGILATDASAIAALPALPTPAFPGLFTIDDAWTDKRITKESEEYSQKLYHYLYKRNLERACLLDLNDAIPSALIADLQDNHGNLLNTSCTALLDYMEDMFGQLRPMDISSVLDTLGTPFDGTTTLAEYYKRQQHCQYLLEETREPISKATMIRTCLGHFQRLPHMAEACDDWDDVHPGTGNTATWVQFKTFFRRKFRQYKNHQDALRHAGIVNSTVTATKVLDLQDKLATLKAQITTLTNLVQQNGTLIQ